MDSYSEHFKAWMDERNFTSKSLAPLIKKGEQTINNWRSYGVPKRESVRSHVTAFMEDYDAKKIAELEALDVISLEVSSDQFDAWNRAALNQGLIMREWMIKGLDQLAKEEPANVTQIRDEKAHLMAAAGSPIEAEVLDWGFQKESIRVKICGESMSPKFNDGEVIEMRQRDVARSPFMKKGLIYLVHYDGGYMVKRYNTRKAKTSEKDAEYLTNTGSVGVLESINPVFPAIDITGPCKWDAWFDEE